MTEATTTVALRSDFATAVKQRGITSKAEMARAFGVNESTIGRLLRGETDPSARFINGVLRAFPNGRFEDFFEVQ